MKLLPFFDDKMSVEKLHIFNIDIYGADTKKISYFKVEEEIFKYLNKYHKCLSSFSMAMTNFYGHTFTFFQFGEYGEELESVLREMKEIYDNMKIVNKNKESIILSILNNDQLETINLNHISTYRFLLDDIYIDSPSRVENNDYDLTTFERIKKCFEDNSTIHFTDVAKEAIVGITSSYYENNKIINLLSKKIIINDDKRNLFILPENYEMYIDEKERREEEEENDTREIQEFLNGLNSSVLKKNIRLQSDTIYYVFIKTCSHYIWNCK